MGYQEEYITSVDLNEFEEIVEFIKNKGYSYVSKLGIALEMQTINENIKPKEHYGIQQYKNGGFGPHRDDYDVWKSLVEYNLEHLPDEYNAGHKFVFARGDRGDISTLLSYLIDNGFKYIDCIYAEDMPKKLYSRDFKHIKNNNGDILKSVSSTVIREAL